MKKKRTKFSVLTRQKPRRGRKQPLATRVKFWSFIAVFVVALASVSYGVWRIKTKGVFVTDAAHPIDWRIAVKPPAEGPLAESALEQTLRQPNATQATAHAKASPRPPKPFSSSIPTRT